MFANILLAALSLILTGALLVRQPVRTKLLPLLRRAR